MRPRRSKRIDSARCAWLALALLSACGSSSGGSGPRPQDAATEVDAAPAGCSPGETLADDGHCEPAGIPPSMCGTGFQPDGDRGCDAILPADPCPKGKMATPGETTCHEVALCGDGTWGSVPVDATTQFVDRSFAGTSDGSAKAPWTTIHDAIKAAAPGAIVAVAAGSYAENVVVGGKPVKLWGRCPSMVEIVGSAGVLGAVVIAAGVSSTEVHALAIRGGSIGLALSGSKDVVVDRVWIHDTASRGLDFESALGPTSVTVTHSLVEQAHDVGVFALGATVTMDTTVVRDTNGAADGSNGQGVAVQNAGDQRASGTLRSIVVERARNVGVMVIASDVTIDASVVRDTQPDTNDRSFGQGIEVHNDVGRRAAVTVRASVVAGNREHGIIIAGSDATIEATEVRDTQAQDSDGAFGRGIEVRYAAGQRADVTVQACLVRSNRDVGVFIDGSDAKIAASAIRDTQPRASDRTAGCGIVVQYDPSSGARSTSDIRGTVVEASRYVGVLVVGADVVADGVLVRTTSARESDSLYGDGLAAISDGGPTTVLVHASRIEASARAAIANFGATITLRDATLECAAFALDGETYKDVAGTFEDQGGDVCGCGGATTICHVESNGLAPPKPLVPAK